MAFGAVLAAMTQSKATAFGAVLAAMTRSKAMAFGAVLAATIVATGCADDVSTLQLQAGSPPMPDLEVRVRGPRFSRTFLAEDFNEPCLDTAVCAYASTPPVRIGGPDVLRFDLTVRRGDSVAVSGNAEFLLPGAATGRLTVRELTSEELAACGSQCVATAVIDFPSGDRALYLFWEVG